jgi:hypothetical protein
MAEAPRPPGSRYAPLNVEAILGASAPHTTSASPVHATDDDTIRPTPVRAFTSTPFVYGEAPATQPSSTPAPDHASRAASPDRLEPWEQPSSYLFEGQTVSLDELVSRSAQHHNIPDDIANWVKTVTREVSRADISLVYNTLSRPRRDRVTRCGIRTCVARSAWGRCVTQGSQEGSDSYMTR